jgi:hypothetical protein
MSTTEAKALAVKIAELEEKLKAQEAELAAAKKQRGAALTLRVSQKGAISVYGVGQWPTTLYAETWVRLLPFMAANLDKFIADNRDKLSFKAKE